MDIKKNIVRKHIKGAWIGIIILGCFFGAAQASALTISPLRETVIIDPGKTDTIHIELSNDTESTTTVKISADAFSLDANNRPIFGWADSALSWIHIPEPTLTLAPHEKKLENYIITVPASAEPGSHYFGLFASASASDDAIHVQTRVGSLLFFYVGGQIRESLDVALKDIPTFLTRQKNTPINFAFKNTGTIHVAPKGTLTVTDWQGKTIQIATINAQGKNIFPDTEWTNAIQLQKIPWYKVGPVHLRWQITYGLKARTRQGEQTIWYIPILGMIIGVTILLLTIIGILTFQKHNRK